MLTKQTSQEYFNCSDDIRFASSFYPSKGIPSALGIGFTVVSHCSGHYPFWATMKNLQRIWAVPRHQHWHVSCIWLTLNFDYLKILAFFMHFIDTSRSAPAEAWNFWRPERSGRSPMICNCMANWLQRRVKECLHHCLKAEFLAFKSGKMHPVACAGQTIAPRTDFNLVCIKCCYPLTVPKKNA